MRERRRDLPARPGRLIGREVEVAQLRELLMRPDVRLVTLTGPGGIGKTRLALAVAEELRDRFADGAACVELSAVGGSGRVPLAIARALGLDEPAEEPPFEELERSLRERELLLVLDTFEPYLGVAPRLGELLAACPRLTLLVTCRAPLHLAGEHELAVPPLALPNLDALPPPETLAEVPAVALFVERSRDVRPDFVLQVDDAPVIAAICAHLDGVPLAIELAAARTRLMTPRSILDWLAGTSGRDVLRLLQGGGPERPPRHQTLRAAIGWSYHLLTPDEQALFRRLGIFAGGCTIDAVEAVCADDDGEGLDVLEGLASLVDKSLVRQDAKPDGSSRLSMLEVIREYARDRLRASGEHDRVARRHAEAFLALAESAAPRLTGPEQVVWLDRLEREHDNLSAALRWYAEQGDAEGGLRLAGALGRFWDVRGHLRAGREWLATLLDLPSAVAYPVARARAVQAAASLAFALGERDIAAALHAESLALHHDRADAGGVAAALNGLGAIAALEGDLTAAQTHFEESLQLARAGGDRHVEAAALDGLGMLAHRRGDLESAQPLVEQGLILFRALGDQPAIGQTLAHLAIVARARGDRAGARVLYEESLSRRRRAGDRRGMTGALNGLAQLALEDGDAALARSRLEQALLMARGIDDRLGTATALEGFAVLALLERQPERAVRLAEAAAALRDVTGAPLVAAERERLEARQAAARQLLGDERMAEAQAEGRTMPFERAISEALLDGDPTQAAPARPGEVARPRRSAAPDPAPPTCLTDREREIASLIAHGLSNRLIAEQLVISERTAERHVSNILRKLGLTSRSQVVLWAVERGLVDARAS